ncbi:NAD(P)/FAD-dependent oxidoreductase [Novipirellula artificiosorum]|nr:FAD-dependent oxidoreductase [Novipirellula artificiosorum]
MHIAIIGTGISGSLTARILSSRHDVTVFEANGYAGGHSNTVDVSVQGRPFSVDTGFMVFNERTYPNFCQLLRILGVSSQASDMSFSVRCSNTQTEYQGSSLNGLFAQRTNLFRPSFLRLLWDIRRFNQRGNAAAASGELKDGRSVGAFLEQCGVGNDFVDRYLLPMAAAIWSCPPDSIRSFPADFMVGFFANHGLMQIRDRPQWRTIAGGARVYVDALLDPLRDRLKLSCPVTAVERQPDRVVVTTQQGQAESFDQVVFATHADQTLKLISNPTAAEQEILREFPYQSNQAVLHTDDRLMPDRKRAWASWNYHIPIGPARGASVTYDLSRLQRHHSPLPILLTLNPTEPIAEQKILRTFEYSHPAYAASSIRAQQRFAEVSGNHRTHFCGAYWGYGFHEDGVNSALAVAKYFGLELESCRAASTKERSPIADTVQ